MILLHQILGKCLGALQDRRIFARTEYAEPFSPRTRSTIPPTRGSSMPTTVRSISLFLRKSYKPVEIHRLDIDALRILCNPCIARCTVNLLCLRATAHIFHAIACSLPPLPTIKIFISRPPFSPVIAGLRLYYASAICTCPSFYCHLCRWRSGRSPSGESPIRLPPSHVCCRHLSAYRSPLPPPPSAK